MKLFFGAKGAQCKTQLMEISTFPINKVCVRNFFELFCAKAKLSRRVRTRFNLKSELELHSTFHFNDLLEIELTRDKSGEVGIALMDLDKTLKNHYF